MTRLQFTQYTDRFFHHDSDVKEMRFYVPQLKPIGKGEFIIDRGEFSDGSIGFLLYEETLTINHYRPNGDLSRIEYIPYEQIAYVEIKIREHQKSALV